MTPNQAYLWAALKCGMGYRLKTEWIRRDTEKFGAMKKCPKKLELNYRKVKKKREEMVCDYLNMRRMGATTFYMRSCGNMK